MPLLKGTVSTEYPILCPKSLQSCFISSKHVCSSSTKAIFKIDVTSIHTKIQHHYTIKKGNFKSVKFGFLLIKARTSATLLIIRLLYDITIPLKIFRLQGKLNFNSIGIIHGKVFWLWGMIYDFRWSISQRNRTFSYSFQTGSS